MINFVNSDIAGSTNHLALLNAWVRIAESGFAMGKESHNVARICKSFLNLIY
jgi:hypothetical protein